EDCFDGKDPEEITPFSPPLSTFQTHDLAAMKESIQGKQPALHKNHLEPRSEDHNLPCSSQEEEGK
ncbi:hypothetical protein KI387_009221, partial [Taxus chinensis]